MYNLVKGPTMFDGEYEQIKNGDFSYKFNDFAESLEYY